MEEKCFGAQKADPSTLLFANGRTTSEALIIKPGLARNRRKNSIQARLSH